MSNSKEMERKSSAVTLSDMEVFIFPELIYSLVLANIMSPRIWAWRDDPWFAGMARMKPYRRMTRLKQYIMDHYVFNLDLDTWGLTTKERELARFSSFVDQKTLAGSNALFGYEGDKYYFDIDIRTHFGLEKYEGSVIPYWKTETVEAMDAFCHKPNYNNGAGECVSLATLYAAALFVVAQVPLKDIYLMATPLHSQNFVDIKEGILTNNRRLVTKNMWFNGTALSGQARRALENERVTLIAHESGCIHTIYNEASISESQYAYLTKRLSDYLKTGLTEELLGNFLRNESSLQKCFQVRCDINGAERYIGVERVLAYEQNSPYMLTDNTRAKLMAEIDQEEFLCSPMKSRIILNDLENFIARESIDITDSDDLKKLKTQFASDCLNAEIAIESLSRFCQIHPQMPDSKTKTFSTTEEPLGVDTDMSREEIIERINDISSCNTMAGLAFYTYRDMTKIDPAPFMKAAVQRNPVSIKESDDLSEKSVFEKIKSMTNESIYDEHERLAQPDEVWNFNRGSGAEKALVMANILRNRMPKEEITVTLTNNSVIVHTSSSEYIFEHQLGIDKQIWQIPLNTLENPK